jgi:ribosome-associated protein
MKEVLLTTEPVELYKLLKFEGLVPSGGIAKRVIDGGLVKVNGAVETRKRRKMMSGDIVEYDDELLTLVMDMTGIPDN